MFKYRFILVKEKYTKKILKSIHLCGQKCSDVVKMKLGFDKSHNYLAKSQISL